MKPGDVAKKMLIESGPHETRIAVLENDRLTELFVERPQQRGVVGNIYKGKVHRVLPGMQAAFVNVGLDRDAFLYVDEVASRRLAEVGDGPDGEDDAEGPEAADTLDDVRERSRPSIDHLLTAGQELMVQVLKDPLPNKGARVSTQVTLPGRYLVLLPGSPHAGVSRRIEEEEERERLRSLVEGILPDDHGLIVRTAGAGRSLEELEKDLRFLRRLWERIAARQTRLGAPSLVHRDLDLALRVLRDDLSAAYQVIWVDHEGTYEEVVEFIDQVEPALVGRVRLYEQDEPLLERFGVERELATALDTKVWLKSGGHIVINLTEALVAIDVNTGRFVGRSDLEDTVLTTNLEAVKEIVRQIRLRNLGGIIVIDLIDMEEPSHRERVFAALELELAKDRARKKVLNISEFGLVELTRKRSRPSLERLWTRACPYCHGGGRIKSRTTICLEIHRQLLRRRGELYGREILLRVHPEIAEALQRDEQPILRELERELGGAILVQADGSFHHERYDILDV